MEVQFTVLQLGKYPAMTKRVLHFSFGPSGKGHHNVHPLAKTLFESLPIKQVISIFFFWVYNKHAASFGSLKKCL